MIFGPATSYPFGPLTIDADPYEGPCILHGWSWKNPDLAARADVELTDGPTGQLIVPVTLSPGQSTRDWLSGTGIYVNVGLHVRVLSGTVTGALWATSAADKGHTLPINVHELVDDLIENLHR